MIITDRECPKSPLKVKRWNTLGNYKLKTYYLSYWQKIFELKIERHYLNLRPHLPFSKYKTGGGGGGVCVGVGVSYIFDRLPIRIHENFSLRKKFHY